MNPFAQKLGFTTIGFVSGGCFALFLANWFGRDNAESSPKVAVPAQTTQVSLQNAAGEPAENHSLHTGNGKAASGLLMQLVRKHPQLLNSLDLSISDEEEPNFQDWAMLGVSEAQARRVPTIIKSLDAKPVAAGVVLLWVRGSSAGAGPAFG